MLPRTFFVMRAFRMNAHLRKRQTDFPAHVFAAVKRCNVHIPGSIKGHVGRFSHFVSSEQVKLEFRAKVTGVSCIAHGICRLF